MPSLGHAHAHIFNTITTSSHLINNGDVNIKNWITLFALVHKYSILNLKTVKRGYQWSSRHVTLFQKCPWWIPKHFCPMNGIIKETRWKNRCSTRAQNPDEHMLNVEMALHACSALVRMKSFSTSGSKSQYFLLSLCFSCAPAHWES